MRRFGEEHFVLSGGKVVIVITTKVSPRRYEGHIGRIKTIEFNYF